MEILKRNIRKNFGDTINVYFLGDIHEGNINSDESVLRKAVDVIEDDPNGYWIGMGDYTENIIAGSDPRFNPIEIHRKYKIRDLKDLPRKQTEKIYEILKPIKPKTLALVCGNHEESYIKHNSFDVYDHLAQLLGNPEQLKIGYVGFYKLGITYQQDRKRPNYTVKIALNHGIGGGGKREGYPLNKVHDVFRWFDADISVMGHLHKLVSDRQTFYSITQDDTLKETTRHFGCSGCFLRTQILGNSNYFDHKGKPSSDIGMLKAEITVKKKPEIRLKKVFL